jgi:16S rRNA (adenine1518-N6/adenine1519-N6)-dimethyltransferase
MIPKKHLGQHFLTAPSYAKKIAAAVPAADHEHVLEIGPGQGALSIFLKERFPYFHLVEIDETAIELLSQKLGDGTYTIHHKDVLDFDFHKVGFPLHVVGNLPYSIGAHIIKKTLLYGNDIKSCTFMVQREVAQRIVSATHNKTYGFLSVFCSFFGTSRLLFNVPPGAFFPRPNVDSSVFQITVDGHAGERLPRSQWDPFFAFVSRGFRQRRKKAVNALHDDVHSKDELVSFLASVGAVPEARPEDLDCNQWLEIYKKTC